MKKYTQESVVEILSDLKDAERDIVLKRYNLMQDGTNYTLKAIGNEYGVSAETVRQVELRALRKLKVRSEEMREIVCG
jgi:RNA polymerase primary sigma factor